MVRSVIVKDFDLGKAVEVLRQMIWNQLGYVDQTVAGSKVTAAKA
jgi:hypothetical protein